MKQAFHTILFSLMALAGACIEGNNMSELTEELNRGNLGGSNSIFPANASSAGINGHGQEVEIFRMPGKFSDPRLVTIATMAIPRNFSTNQGPIVGIAEFGTGHGQIQRAEFDIQCNASSPGNNQNVFLGGGVQLTFPATDFRLIARSDANFIPRLGDTALGNVFGPASSVDNETVITGSFGLGNRPGGGQGIYRTITLVNGGAGLAAGANVVTTAIPPFARSFRVLRFSSAQTISIQISGTSVLINGPINVAANADCPTILLPGNSQSIRVDNTGAGGINSVSIQYELSL